MTQSAPKGLFDILPAADLPAEQDLWKSSELWNYVESVIRDTATKYGYAEIRTPVFERTELFSRGVGETSDIVTKEMYSFEDKAGRSMTLRPEGTAAVMRAFLSNNLYNQSPIHKFFYISPMFRYERPQAGRYRQHHQFGVEAIGSDWPEQDAEVIDLLYTTYSRLGIGDVKILINSIGTPESRMKYREALIAFLNPIRENLSEDSQRRLDSNPLRVLDSKDERDIAAVRNAPSIIDFLDSESQDHFEILKRHLEQLNLPFEVKPTLVRGLDYYNKTVFEIVSGSLGAQDSVGGGGRYDGLIKTLGGPDLPAIGFGSGIERIIHTLIAAHPHLPLVQGPLIYFIPLGEKAREFCFAATRSLRHSGISADMDVTGRKLKKVMSYANQVGAHYVAIVGDDEIDKDLVELKRMETGESIPVTLTDMLMDRAPAVEEKEERAQLTDVLGDSSPTTESLDAMREYFQKLKNRKIKVLDNDDDDEVVAAKEDS